MNVVNLLTLFAHIYRDKSRQSIAVSNLSILLISTLFFFFPPFQITFFTEKDDNSRT